MTCVNARNIKRWKGVNDLREQTTIRLPSELKNQLQREADRLGISFNGIIIAYLWKGLEEK